MIGLTTSAGLSGACPRLGSVPEFGITTSESALEDPRKGFGPGVGDRATEFAVSAKNFARILPPGAGL